MFMSVYLPEPLAPMSATNSPRLISSETPRTARTSISPDRYVLQTLSNETSAPFADVDPLAMSILLEAPLLPAKWIRRWRL